MNVNKFIIGGDEAEFMSISVLFRLSRGFLDQQADLPSLNLQQPRVVLHGRREPQREAARERANFTGLVLCEIEADFGK